MKHIFCILIALLAALCVQAQVGYQVALMDQSTGKPRANESVSVTVTISDNAGAVICSETTSATTNQFGMLALQVGNASTFNNVDWNKAPLWVSATVGGVSIGKTQILNVPVAEHAKHWGELTPEILASKTWKIWSPKNTYGTSTYKFDKSGNCTYTYTSPENSYSMKCSYSISGNSLCVYGGYDPRGEHVDDIFIYFPDMNALACDGSVYK